MTNELKAIFVDETNKLRNEQALGESGGNFRATAADMATVVS